MIVKKYNTEVGEYIPFVEIHDNKPAPSREVVAEIAIGAVRLAAVGVSLVAVHLPILLVKTGYKAFKMATTKRNTPPAPIGRDNYRSQTTTINVINNIRVRPGTTVNIHNNIIQEW